MACKTEIDIEAVCDQIRTSCPWVESLRCFANNGATEIFTVLSNGAISEDPVCLIPHGLTEEQICELIIQKAPEALTEEQICELILSKTLSEDDVCQLIKDTAILPSTLCAKIAELCPHVKDVAKVNGALVFTFTNNVEEPFVCPLPQSTAVDNGDGTTTTTHPDETTHTSCNNPSKSFAQNPVTGVITNTYQDGTTDKAAVTTIGDNGDNTASAVNFDGSPCVLVKASAFSFNADGQCTLTLPGKDAIDIQDDVSVEVVLVTDLGDGTGEVTGTNSTTCTFMKPPVSWEPADPADPGTWLADPANPGDAMSLVKDGDLLCGVVLGGAVCEIPKPVAEWSTTIAQVAGDEFPTTPTVPGTCSKVVNEEGELIGTVDDDGPHPIPVSDPVLVEDHLGDELPINPLTGNQVLPEPATYSGVDGQPIIPEADGSLCLAPGLVDCDGSPLVKNDGLVRKLLDPAGDPLPTDGMGNQQMPCVVKAITLVKTALPGPYQVGDQVAYSFSVTNNGTVPLAPVTLMDSKGDVVGGPIASLASGATDTTTFTMTYTYTQEDFDNGGCVNIATASGVAPDGTVVSDMDSQQIFNLPPEEMPDILLEKIVTSGAGPYMEGDTVDYAFVVTNTGDVALTGVQVADPLLTVAGGPISLNVSSMDSVTFTGSYVIQAADVPAGGGTLDNTATVSGTSPAGTVVTSQDSASVPTSEGPQLVKRCAFLPEIQLDRVLVDPTNLITNDLGDDYYTSSTYNFVSPGGVVLGTGSSQNTADVYDFVTPEGNNTVSGNLAIITGSHPAPWIGDAAFWTTPDVAGRPTSPVTWSMSTSSAPGDSDGSIQGCESSFRTEVGYHDVDQGSTVLDLSRPWDTEINDWQSSSGPYTDNGDGSFTFPQGAGGNWYVYWNMAGQTDTVSSTYIQNTNDGTIQTHRMFWTPAVCVMEDVDGNIVSAETVDGPLDPARYNELTFA